MYSLILTLIILLLTSCATTNSYDKKIANWQGKPVSLLVSQAGTPNVKIAAGSGYTYYGYITSSGEFYPPGNTAPTAMTISEGKPVIVQNRVNIPYDEQGYGLKCTTLFKINSSQIIVGTQSKGSCMLLPKLMPPH